MNSSNSWETSKLARSCCVNNQQHDVGKKACERTNIGHKRRIELLRLQPLPIKWGEPTMAPDLLRVRDARPTTQSLLRVSLEKLWSNHASIRKRPNPPTNTTHSEDGGGTFATDWTMALRWFPDRMCQNIVPHFVRRVAVKRAPVPE
jgi:hypothetical protein